MLAVNYSTVRNNFKNYCDMASENNETIIVTRKDEKNIVLLNLAEYNLMLKRINNAKYLEKLTLSMNQLRSGKGQERQLIEDEEEFTNNENNLF